MDLTPYVASLRDDLAAAASVGDEQTARAGTALAGALEPAVRLALMNALSDLAAEISGSLDDHTVSLRLRGREVDVVVDRDAAPSEPDASADGGFFAGPASSPFAGPSGGFRRPGFERPGFDRPGAGAGAGDMGDISRMTLRLVDQIKGQAEQAAAAQGMSLNSWISQAVQGALHDGMARSERRRNRRGPGADGLWGDGRWDGDGPGSASGGSPSGNGPAGDTPSGGSSTPPSSGGGPRDDEGPDDGRGVTGWVRG